MAFGFTRTVIAFLIVIFGVIIVILMSSLGRAFAPADPFQETFVPVLACQFTNTTPRTISIYSAPVSAEMLEVDELADSQQLEVTKIRETHVFVKIRGNYGGWVELNLGQLNGNCDEVERDEKPLTDFPTVCFFLPTEQTTLYSDSTLQTASQSLLPEEFYVIFGQTENTYRIRVSGLISGYADKTKGITRGACGLVPMFENG